MIAVILTLAAGSLGAVLRFLTSRAFGAQPIRAVLIVNVVGSAIGGAVLGLAQAGSVSADIRLILLTGFCGGLTTFSTFSVETIQLVMDGKAKLAALNVVANLALGISAAASAYALVMLALPQA